MLFIKTRSGRRLLIWSAVVLWVFALLFLTSRPQLSSLNATVLDKFLETINRDFRGLTVDQQKMDVWVLQISIRKTGHFIAFTGLGLLLLTALYEYSIRSWIRVAAVLFICIGLAGAEEIRQIFQAGRTPLIIDVVIGACGTLFGIVIAVLLRRRWIRKQGKKHRESGQQE